MSNLVEFFKLDGRKTLLTLIFVIIGLAILLFFIWTLVSGKFLFGQRPNSILLGLISAFSPLFGVAIMYIYAFKTIPAYIFVLINILSILQFLHWYYLACLAAYIQDRFFKKEE
jgi:hypothetical protein